MDLWKELLILKIDTKSTCCWKSGINTKFSSRKTLLIDLQEESDLGADGQGTYNTFSDVVQEGSLRIQYEVFQVYNAYDPTVVQIFFVLSNQSVRFFSYIILCMQD